ncbi:MAG: anion permease, partial [Anaerotardibacter sp.]
ISTVVGTRTMSPGKAIIMAAICNFVGLLVIVSINSAVANTIFTMVNFGDDVHYALLALAAAMISIIVWGGAAWALGIPTSQSHSLIAGLTGAAIGVMSGVDGINIDAWMKVIYGLIISSCLGFACGYLFTKGLEKLCGGMDRRKTTGFWNWALKIVGAGVALMHGAQDGQKFLSICMLGILLCMGTTSTADVQFPLWLIILCAASMGLGTAVGGKKIIKSVGLDMVKMEPYQGFAASASTVFCLALSTFTGMPVSTTQTSTTAIMGVGASKRLRAVKWDMAGNMVLTWILTFPGCGIIGFVLAKIFLLF